MTLGIRHVLVSRRFLWRWNRFIGVSGWHPRTTAFCGHRAYHKQESLKNIQSSQKYINEWSIITGRRLSAWLSSEVLEGKGEGETRPLGRLTTRELKSTPTSIREESVPGGLWLWESLSSLWKPTFKLRACAESLIEKNCHADR